MSSFAGLRGLSLGAAARGTQLPGPWIGRTSGLGRTTHRLRLPLGACTRSPGPTSRDAGDAQANRRQPILSGGAMPRTASIPYDEDAETIVVAHAIWSGESASAAGRMLDATDFYDQGLARIFDAAIQLGNLRSVSRRIEILAEALDLSEHHLETIAARRPGADFGDWRRRVRELARRRRLMGLAAHLYNGAAHVEISTLDELVRLISQEALLLTQELASEQTQGA
jgi:hypothetical protein